MATAIKLYVDSEGTKKINEYLSQNELILKGKFHSTIFYTGGECFLNKEKILQLIDSYLPIEVCPPYSIDIFGVDELVLRYENNFVKELNSLICKEEKPMTEYTTFNPHITIVKNFRGNLAKLSLFENEIKLDGIEWKVI